MAAVETASGSSIIGKGLGTRGGVHSEKNGRLDSAISNLYENEIEFCLA